MIDSHLAELYGVKTKVLNQSVRRNAKRFPQDFMFQLTREEAQRLRSQFVTLKKNSKRGQHIKYLPRAFTEQGIAMLSSVLNSNRAIEMNILIMRAFVKLRQVLATHKDLAQKFKELESRVDTHDIEIQAICKVIKRMLAVEQKPRKRIGFVV